MKTNKTHKMFTFYRFMEGVLPNGILTQISKNLFIDNQGVVFNKWSHEGEFFFQAKIIINPNFLD